MKEKLFYLLFLMIFIFPISVVADSSKSSVVMDLDSGRVLYENHVNDKRLIASTTKIMTAIVVLENADLTDVVTIDKKAAGTGGSRLGLKFNDIKQTIGELLGKIDV